MNSVDNTKLPCYTLPWTQHHSFFRNLCTYHRPSPGGGTPGKGGDFVKDPVKVLIFPLLGGDTEESKFPSLRGITLSSLKPDKKTVLYNLNEMSCFNSAYIAIVISEEGNSGNNTMEMDLHYNTCAIRRGRHHKHEEKGGPRSSAQWSLCFFI